MCASQGGWPVKALSAPLVVLCLAWPGDAAAQDWAAHVSVQDGFAINFPGAPRVTQTTWTSQLGFDLPARIYSAERGSERYSVTVVDYSGIEQLGAERAKNCPPGNANCRANAPPALGPGYSRHDERGALLYATKSLLKRNATMTELAWDWQDMVEGHVIQLTNAADESRTFAYVAMHEHRLYIVEGTVPKGRPEPGLFQQSLGWLDKDGRGIRYQNIVYSNAYHALGVYPAPPHAAPADNAANVAQTEQGAARGGTNAR
jgi:hypothetical protein